MNGRRAGDPGRRTARNDRHRRPHPPTHRLGGGRTVDAPACARPRSMRSRAVIHRPPADVRRDQPTHARTSTARTATLEVFSMKFRVARDDLADAVAWVAKSLPTRPPVPVLGGILLEVNGSTLTVAGFDYEVSTRATVSVDTLDDVPRCRRRCRGAEPNGCWSPAGCSPRSPGRCRPSRSTWPWSARGCRIVAGSARFTLPTMPVEDYPPLPQMPRLVRHGRLRGVRRGRRADRGRRRPRRHAADADRHPGRDRGRDADAGRHRPVPAGRPRTQLAARTSPTCPPRCWCPARTLADAAKTLGGASRRSPSRSATGCSAWRPAAAAPRSGCWTSSS